MQRKDNWTVIYYRVVCTSLEKLLFRHLSESVESQCQKKYHRTYTPTEDSDQPVPSHSLIRIHTGCILDSQGCKVSTCAQWILNRLRACAGWIVFVERKCQKLHFSCYGPGVLLGVSLRSKGVNAIFLSWLTKQHHDLFLIVAYLFIFYKFLWPLPGSSVRLAAVSSDKIIVLIICLIIH